MVVAQRVQATDDGQARNLWQAFDLWDVGTIEKLDSCVKNSDKEEWKDVRLKQELHYALRLLTCLCHVQVGTHLVLRVDERVERSTVVG